MSEFDRFVGIDWSGAEGEHQKGIAVALCERDGFCTLMKPSGRTRWSRQAVLDLLIACEPPTLAGLDFAFSLPWPNDGPLPLELKQPTTARELWRAVDRVCCDEPHFYAGPVYRPNGGWLAEYMFTKLTGQPRWTGIGFRADRLRRTEQVAASAPNSAFKVVGAKTVGPGSFAGMRVLAELDRRLGRDLAVWPFDPLGSAGLTLAEIYPSQYYVAAGHRRSFRVDVVRTVLSAFDARLDADVSSLSQDEADALVGAAALRFAAMTGAGLSVPDDAPAEEGWIVSVPPR